MKEEEGWKKFLNWGAVLMFLFMPILIMVLQLIALSFPGWLKEALPQNEFKYLYEFQRALAVLVFGLSGLRTWEVIKETNGKHDTKPDSGTKHRAQHTGGHSQRHGVAEPER